MAKKKSNGKFALGVLVPTSYTNLLIKVLYLVDGTAVPEAQVSLIDIINKVEAQINEDGTTTPPLSID